MSREAFEADPQSAILERHFCLFRVVPATGSRMKHRCASLTVSEAATDLLCKKSIKAFQRCYPQHHPRIQAPFQDEAMVVDATLQLSDEVFSKQRSRSMQSHSALSSRPGCICECTAGPRRLGRWETCGRTPACSTYCGLGMLVLNRGKGQGLSIECLLDGHIESLLAQQETPRDGSDWRLGKSRMAQKHSFRNHEDVRCSATLQATRTCSCLVDS